MWWALEDGLKKGIVSAVCSGTIGTRGLGGRAVGVLNRLRRIFRYFSAKRDGRGTVIMSANLRAGCSALDGAIRARCACSGARLRASPRSRCAGGVG